MEYARVYPPNAIDPNAPPVPKTEQQVSYVDLGNPVWIAARDEYLEGYTAERICQRYGLSMSTFRTRARREGWRRADQDNAALDADDLEGVPDITPREAPTTPQLVDLAWKAMAEAVRKGRAYEARAWMRLHDELKERVRQEESQARHDAAMAAKAGASPSPYPLPRAGEGGARPEQSGGGEGEGAQSVPFMDQLHALHSEAMVQLETRRREVADHRAALDAHERNDAGADPARAEAIARTRRELDQYSAELDAHEREIAETFALVAALDDTPDPPE